MTDYNVEGYFVSKQEVQRLIGKRSNTTISLIKRKIRNKSFIAGSIGVLLLTFGTYVLIAKEPVFDLLKPLIPSQSNLAMGTFYLVFGLVVSFISVFNAFSYCKILKTEEHKSDLKTSIKNILTIVRSAIRVKIYSDTLVVPGTVLTLGIIDAIQGVGIYPNITTLIFFVLGAVAFAIFTYFLTKYGQNKRYAKQIRALEECLKELKEEN